MADSKENDKFNLGVKGLKTAKLFNPKLTENIPMNCCSNTLVQKASCNTYT